MKSTSGGIGDSFRLKIFELDPETTGGTAAAAAVARNFLACLCMGDTARALRIIWQKMSICTIFQRKKNLTTGKTKQR